jgi:hypothetical protein
MVTTTDMVATDTVDTEVTEVVTVADTEATEVDMEADTVDTDVVDTADTVDTDTAIKRYPNVKMSTNVSALAY